VSLKTRSTFVLTHPSEIVQAMVGLKDVVVLHYERSGPNVELMIEQVLDEVRCPRCNRSAQVKERPVVHYVDLPVYGTPMSLAWKKHRIRCPTARCPMKTWVLSDHRIAAKNCLLTTRAAKWATVQVGGGRTVSEAAAELACDWHTVNDAVVTYSPNQLVGVCPGQGSVMASAVLSQWRQARRPTPQRQGWQAQPATEECARCHVGSGDASWLGQPPQPGRWDARLSVMVACRTLFDLIKRPRPD